MRRTLILIILAGALSSCGGATSMEPATEASEVAVRSFEFVPTEIRVATGDTVTWANEDDILHTATSGTAGEQGVPGVGEDVPPMPDGTFDLQLDGRGSTASFTFRESGTYRYFCAIHAGMSGVVVVA